MGRLVRRFIRAYEVTITHKLTINKVFTVDYTGEVFVSNPIAEVADGITVTGAMRAVYAQTFVGAGSEVTGYWEGIRVNMWADATSTTLAISAIHVNNYIEVAPTGNYFFADLRENAGIIVTAAINVGIGAATDITNLFRLGTIDKTAWNSVTDPPGAARGRIAVEVAGTQRYIQLYQ